MKPGMPSEERRERGWDAGDGFCEGVGSSLYRDGK